MERHNRFDEAVKARLGGLEDEPSRRVWTGVSDAIGTVRPPQASANPWIFRVAAAAAILVAVGVGYMLWPAGSGMQKAMAIKDRARAPRIMVVPIDPTGKDKIFYANDAQPQPVQKPQPRNHQPGSWAHQPQPAPFHRPAPDTLKSLTPNGMGPDPIQEKVIAHDDAPKVPSPDDVKNTKAPLLEPEEAKAIASNTSKRSIRIPDRDELTSENLRRKSGAILGTITNGANDLLGLNASYNEKQEDDHKMTAFNADFGLFKIKRVKTVKQ
jgi:hypothetical protein